MGLTDFFKTGPSFKASELRESSEDLCNPDRGWYRMYTYDLRKEGPGRDELPEITGIAPSMVLLLFCIGSVSEDGSSQAVLADRMLGIIDHFYGQGKDIILRVTYDTCGHALENEPYYYEQVLRDAGLVRNVLARAGSRVFIYQGLLVGNWGEMHTSRYTDAASFTGIYDRIKGLGSEEPSEGHPECFFAVRRPDIHRQLDNNDRRLGLFDDAIFASESDMGTYKDQDADPEYESSISLDSPNGGEAVYGGGYIDRLKDNEVISFLQKKRITYLNMDYDPLLLEKLKEREGLFDSVSRRLGYRLFVRNVKFSRSKNILQINISNNGFAPLYRETKSCIILKSQGLGEKCIDIPADMGRSIMPGETESIQVCIPGGYKDGFSGTVYVYLKTVRMFDGKTIRYANICEDDGSVLLGELR